MIKPWIAVDLDSTIANCDHRLVHILDMKTGIKLPKNQRSYTKFYQNCIADTPIDFMIEFLSDRYPRDMFDWVFITGRPEKMRTETVEWLVTHLGYEAPTFSLYMRQEGDSRVDGVTKGELMDGAIADLGSVPVACFDDRKSVIDSWRAKGLTVHDVKELARDLI